MLSLKKSVRHYFVCSFSAMYSFRQKEKEGERERRRVLGGKDWCVGANETCCSEMACTPGVYSYTQENSDLTLSGS